MISKEQLDRLDEQKMMDLMKGFPSHWKGISETTSDVSLNIDQSKIQNICFAGMGGSAIGADLARAYAATTSRVPIQVIRHYDIPAYIDENTLFIACSYSGNTEETMSALNQAINTGAQIIGVTSGGTLETLAHKHGFDYISIPGGMPPRAALAYSFVPVFRILQYLDLIDEGEDARLETEKLLFANVDAWSNLSGNYALEIARKLEGSLPIIYSDGLLLDPVNMRWRGQLEENSKALTYGSFFPEMNHNEIIGWEKIDHLEDLLAVIFLVDKEDNKRVRFREEVFQEIIKDDAKSITVIESQGSSKLARMFSLIQLADWVSLYLAILNGVNPTTIKNIDFMKGRLAEYK